jgi:hypothetical protein
LVSNQSNVKRFETIAFAAYFDTFCLMSVEIVKNVDSQCPRLN